MSRAAGAHGQGPWPRQGGGEQIATEAADQVELGHPGLTEVSGFRQTPLLVVLKRGTNQKEPIAMFPFLGISLQKEQRSKGVQFHPVRLHFNLLLLAVLLIHASTEPQLNVPNKSYKLMRKANSVSENLICGCHLISATCAPCWPHWGLILASSQVARPHANSTAAPITHCTSLGAR